MIIVTIIIISISIFYAYRCFDYMFACVSHSCSWSPEVWFWKSNLGSLEEQQVPLTPAPPFQLWKLFLLVTLLPLAVPPYSQEIGSSGLLLPGGGKGLKDGAVYMGPRSSASYVC